MATTPDVANRALTSPRRAKTVTAPVVHVVAGYAGLVTRAIAAAIDALLIDLAALFVAAVVALVLSIFPITHDTKAVLAVIGGVLFAVWVIAYFVTFWTTTGQTPGDRTRHSQAIREAGGALGPWRAAPRLVAAVVGLISLLGYVPILLNVRRRGLHDWMAETVVIEAQPRGATP